ncbi:MAG: hypothetical protein P8049_10675 [Gemmatimonadota bacterium]
MNRFLPPLLIGIAVFLGLSVIRWLLRPEPEPPMEPTVLSMPGMLGCWEIDTGEWLFEADSDTPAPAGDVHPDSATRALLTVPDRVLLMPDSIDEWRRPFVTYRAAPVAGQYDERLGDYLRWFLRADTLWLVWSDRTVRAGLALLSGEEQLEGAGRALIEPRRSGTPRIGGKISATAWKVNCATGLREIQRSGPRR